MGGSSESFNAGKSVLATNRGSPVTAWGGGTAVPVQTREEYNNALQLAYSDGLGWAEPLYNHDVWKSLPTQYESASRQLEAQQREQLRVQMTLGRTEYQTGDTWLRKQVLG